MTTCKAEALRRVHLYAIGGSAFALLPLPVSTSAGLATLETHMLTMIGEIYGENVRAAATTAAGGGFALIGQGLKSLATKAARFDPTGGRIIRFMIAGAVVEAFGRAIIAHFERKYPGKVFAKM